MLLLNFLWALLSLLNNLGSLQTFSLDLKDDDVPISAGRFFVLNSLFSFRYPSVFNHIFAPPRDCIRGVRLLQSKRCSTFGGTFRSATCKFLFDISDRIRSRLISMHSSLFAAPVGSVPYFYSFVSQNQIDL